MYRECFANADQTLLFLVVFLSISIIGLLCAVERNALAARRYRRLFNETRHTLAETRLDLASARFARTFTSEAAE